MPSWSTSGEPARSVTQRTGSWLNGPSGATRRSHRAADFVHWALRVDGRPAIRRGNQGDLLPIIGGHRAPAFARALANHGDRRVDRARWCRQVHGCSPASSRSSIPGPSTRYMGVNLEASSADAADDAPDPDDQARPRRPPRPDRPRPARDRATGPRATCALPQFRRPACGWRTGSPRSGSARPSPRSCSAAAAWSLFDRHFFCDYYAYDVPTPARVGRRRAASTGFIFAPRTHARPGRVPRCAGRGAPRAEGRRHARVPRGAPAGLPSPRPTCSSASSWSMPARPPTSSSTTCADTSSTSSEARPGSGSRRRTTEVDSVNILVSSPIDGGARRAAHATSRRRRVGAPPHGAPPAAVDREASSSAAASDRLRRSCRPRPACAS